MRTDVPHPIVTDVDDLPDIVVTDRAAVAASQNGEREAGNSSAMTGSPVRFRVFDRWPEDTDVCAGWDRAVMTMEFSNVFLTREWIECWWRWFGNGKELRLGVAWRGGQVLGIAPFYAGRLPVLRMLQVPAVRLIGAGQCVSPDFLGPIAGRGDEDVFADLVALNWGRIAREEREIVLLSDMLMTSSPTRSFLAALGRDREVRRQGEIIRCPYADLPRSYEAFLAGLGARQREGIRRRKRRVERVFRVALACVKEPEAVDEAFDLVQMIYAESERGRGEIACFGDAMYAGFHRDVAKRFAQRGWLRLFLLSLDDTPVAYLYGYLFGGRFWFYQTGYLATCREYGPGALLMQFVIEWAIAEGVETFEFLRGEEAYKYHFASGERTTETVALFPPGAISSVMWFEDGLRRAWRALRWSGS